MHKIRLISFNIYKMQMHLNKLNKNKKNNAQLISQLFFFCHKNENKKAIVAFFF